MVFVLFIVADGCCCSSFVWVLKKLLVFVLFGFFGGVFLLLYVFV